MHYLPNIFFNLPLYVHIFLKIFYFLNLFMFFTDLCAYLTESPFEMCSVCAAILCIFDLVLCDPFIPNYMITIRSTKIKTILPLYILILLIIYEV